MKKTLSLLVLTLFICAPNYFFAQLIKDGAGVAVTMHSKSNFKDSFSDKQYLDNQFRYNTYDYWLPIPPFRMGRTSVLGTINYRLMDFKFDKEITINPNYLTKIHEFKTVIVLRRPVGGRLGVFGIMIPTVASDFKNKISSEDLILDGVFGISRKFGKRSNLEIGIGPHIMYAFGKFLITPGVAVDYRSSNGKWVGQLYWPRVSVLRKIGNNSQFGLAGSVNWTLHNLKNFKNYEGKEVDYAQFSSIHGGLQINQRLFDNFWLQLQGGVGLLNKYTLMNSSHDTISNYSADKTFYAKMMITYRFGK